MRLIEAKTAKQIEDAIRAPRGGRPLVELTTIDKTVKGVRIGTAHFSQESYSSFKALVEQPFDIAKRHRLTATIAGFAPAISYHDSDYDARASITAMADGAVIDVAEVDVFINDDGEIVGEASEPAAPSPLTIDDVPF